MKINKLTLALSALGIVSLASVAEANNTIIYLTGSTAARSQIFSAMTTTGQVFPVAGTVVTPPGGSSSSSQIVYRGTLSNGDTVDYDCTFTGSEAGIAAVAGQSLTQSLPNDFNGAGPYALPGVGSGLTFLTPDGSATPNYSGTSTLPNGVGNNQGVNVTVPDLTMADTSQAVSRTPSASFPLTDFGAVGVVPFTFMKGYQATPSTPYGHINNITTSQAQNILASGQTVVNVKFLTGVSTDTGKVGMIGRNFGSGTRVNTMDNASQQAITAVLAQCTFSGASGTANTSLLYPAATPGVLTFPNSCVAGQPMVNIGDDGYDSGSKVGFSLNVDGTGNNTTLLGYLGLSDAKNASGNGTDNALGLASTGSNPATDTVDTGAGAAQFIQFNGVYESDAGVEQGTYTYWGYEHVLGTQTASSADASAAGTSLVSGIEANITSLGSATGDVTVEATHPQSALIPLSKMVVKRTASLKDTGFPK